MKNFIIVGRGLAATCLMHQFSKNNISFTTIGDSQLSLSSKIAAGIWNPVVFKRLTSSWMANILIPKLLEFYSACEKTLNTKLITDRILIKPFTEEQEKVLWKKKAKNELIEFLDDKIYSSTDSHKHLKIINQFAKVKQTGNIDVAEFIRASDICFADSIQDEIFDYSQLQIHEATVSYKNIHAQNIIFCEGHLVKYNPYFNWLPMVPAKGETITIKCDHLKLKNFIFNRDGFIMDIGENIYKVGATYEWKEVNDNCTNQGLNTLKQKLDKMIDADYQIISHDAGVRPSSKDRRPIIGTHPKYANLFVFNGLGAKGVMLAPFFSENFVHFYLQKEKLHNEVDIKRFY